MTTLNMPAEARRNAATSDTLLRHAAALWWAATLIGQWVFLYYIATAYGPSTLGGDPAAWMKNPNHIIGYVPGDRLGNAAFGAHALVVALLMSGGALQLVPWIRRRAPRLHRWIGRSFMAAAAAGSITGLYMVWLRGATLSSAGSIAITGNAALLILFAVLAWRAARARDFAAHRIHALRLFMVAGGQWLFRVAIFGWILVNQGPVGLGDHFDGPVVLFWEYGCYLVPLVLLELYLRAQTGSPRLKAATAAVLFAASAYIAAGTAGAWLIIWQPALARL